MTKEEMMDYFKNNAETLDPIEGVWVESETIRWVNVTSGLRGAQEYPRSYVLAVIRDPGQQNVFNYNDLAKVDYNALKAATIIVAIIPILVIYPVVLKYYTKDALAGSIKE